MKGFEELYEFELSNGGRFKCTRGHRLLASGGFVTAGSVSVGDDVFSYSQSPQASTWNPTLQFKRKVLTVLGKQLKILRRIILLVPVLVMDNLSGFQIPANHLLHHKPVLKNVIGVLPSIWVALAVNQDITILVNQSPLPSVVILSGFPVTIHLRLSYNTLFL